MESSEALSLVQDTKLNAKVDLWSTEHVFDRRGRPDGPREVWKREQRLGQGAYGTVWLERCSRPYRRNTPDVRAVKEIFLQSGKRNQVDYTRELLAFAKFSQPKFEPYFVRSFGWYSTPESVFITTAYHQLGDLQRYLNAALPETEVRDIAEQLLEGLKHMHDNGFAHRDLKPKNVLVGAKGPRWSVQITDFGISKKLQDDHVASATMFQGSPGFMAPEMIIRTLKGPHFAVDLWSLGSMAYYMLTNRMILRDLAQLHEYGKGAREVLSTDYADVEASEHAKDFISSLLARAPGDRPTADEALASEWMSDISMYPSAGANTQERSSSPASQEGPEIVAPEAGSTNIDELFASKTWSSDLAFDPVVASSSSTPAPSSRQDSEATLKPAQPDAPLPLPARPKSSLEVERVYPTPEPWSNAGNSAPSSIKASKRKKKPALRHSNPFAQPQDYGVTDTRPTLTPAAAQQSRFGGREPRTEPQFKSILKSLISGSSPSSTKMRITVRPMKSKIGPTHFDVWSDESLFDLKRLIAAQIGVPADSQGLHFEGQDLEDVSKPLSAFGIHDNADIYLMIKSSRKEEQDKEGMVYVLIKKDQRLGIRFNPNSPVLAIKQDIEEQEGIPVARQRLTLNGWYLDNNASAKSCGIKIGEVIGLTVDLSLDPDQGRMLAIIVTPLGEESFNIMVYAEDTIFDLKQRIEEERRIPVLRQKLVFNEEQLEDEALIRKYKIRSGDTIDMITRPVYEMKFANHKPVFIKMVSGKIFTIEVDPVRPVWEIKHAIERMEGTPPDCQRLVFNGQQLVSDKLARDYRIRRHDTIHLLTRTIGSRRPMPKWPGRPERAAASKEEEELVLI